MVVLYRDITISLDIIICHNSYRIGRIRSSQTGCSTKIYTCIRSSQGNLLCLDCAIYSNRLSTKRKSCLTSYVHLPGGHSDSVTRSHSHRICPKSLSIAASTAKGHIPACQLHRINGASCCLIANYIAAHDKVMYVFIIPKSCLPSARINSLGSCSLHGIGIDNAVIDSGTLSKSRQLISSDCHIRKVNMAILSSSVWPTFAGPATRLQQNIPSGCRYCATIAADILGRHRHRGSYNVAIERNRPLAATSQSQSIININSTAYNDIAMCLIDSYVHFSDINITRGFKIFTSGIQSTSFNFTRIINLIGARKSHSICVYCTRISDIITRNVNALTSFLSIKIRALNIDSLINCFLSSRMQTNTASRTLNYIFVSISCCHTNGSTLHVDIPTCIYGTISLHVSIASCLHINLAICRGQRASPLHIYCPCSLDSQVASLSSNAAFSLQGCIPYLRCNVHSTAAFNFTSTFKCQAAGININLSRRNLRIIKGKSHIRPYGRAAIIGNYQIYILYSCFIIGRTFPFSQSKGFCRPNASAGARLANIYSFTCKCGILGLSDSAVSHRNFAATAKG